MLRWPANAVISWMSQLARAKSVSHRCRGECVVNDRTPERSVSTRNQRLAALRTFYRYLATHDPEMLGEAERVEAIPTKRTSPPETIYLERNEIETLFKALPRQGSPALRDRALFMLLYNTGARVQEIADLRVGDVDLEPPLRARLHGKGDKWRKCPLWRRPSSF